MRPPAALLAVIACLALGSAPLHAAPEDSTGDAVLQLLQDKGLLPTSSQIESNALVQQVRDAALELRMVKIGEMTGQLDTSLRNVSYFFTRDVDEQLEQLQSMIEPLLTLVMGALLGWVMLAVLGPVYDSISQFQS